MVFLKAMKKLFWAYSCPSGEYALQVCWRGVEFASECCQRWLRDFAVLLKYLNGLFNQAIVFAQFKLFHVRVLNGYSLCQCGSYSALGQSVSCANFKMGAQYLKQFTHKLHSFSAVLFYILWVLFDL